MSHCTKTDILAATERRVKPVTFGQDVPFVGGKTIYVRSLTARERGLFERSFRDKGGMPIAARQAELRERIAILCACDADGNCLFGKEDLEALKQVDSAVLEAINAAATEHNNFDQEDLDDLAGNSAATGDDSTSSSSPNPAGRPTPTSSSTE